jgi:hypothetical protein
VESRLLSPISMFSSNSRKIDLVAIHRRYALEAKVILFGKLTATSHYFFVIRLFILLIYYRFRVIRRESIRPLQRRPYRKKNNFFRKSDPDFPLMVLDEVRPSSN